MGAVAPVRLVYTFRTHMKCRGLSPKTTWKFWVHLWNSHENSRVTHKIESSVWARPAQIKTLDLPLYERISGPKEFSSVPWGIHYCFIGTNSHPWGESIFYFLDHSWRSRGVHGPGWAGWGISRPVPASNIYVQIQFHGFPFPSPSRA